MFIVDIKVCMFGKLDDDLSGDDVLMSLDVIFVMLEILVIMVEDV